MLPGPSPFCFADPTGRMTGEMSQKAPDGPGPGQVSAAEHAIRSAEIAELRRATGWTWDSRELASFLTPPRQSSREHMSWRRNLAARAAAESGATASDLRQIIDRVTAKVRELVRIVGADPRTADLCGSHDQRSGPSDCGTARVTDRLGLGDSAGGPSALSGLSGESLVSPDLADRYFDAAGSLAGVFCHPAEPECEDCPVLRLCRNGRQRFRARSLETDRYTVVDLFCGAGGMSAGFEAGGFRIVGAVELDAVSASTFRLNHPCVCADDVIVGDLTDFAVKEQTVSRIGSQNVDVLIGGPPCQGFSSAGFSSKRALRSRLNVSGFRLEDDDRNYLFEEFIEMAMRLRPKVAVMENVPGMDAARKGGRSFMALAGSMLEALGYSTAVWEIDASSYGVPQRRIRRFLVAALGPVTPTMPEPEYRGRTRATEADADLLPPVSLRHAIADLPPVDAGRGEAVAPALYLSAESDRELKHFVTARSFPMRRGDRVLVNHRSRYNNQRDLELFSILGQGENGYDAVYRHGRDDLMRYRRDAFHDKYYRMRASEPSRTIVAHLMNDGNSFIHPEQVRSLTPREGARVQSFPDSYWFTGTQGDQWRQIGNAVPPLLAFHIAKAVGRHLQRMSAG